MPAIKIFPRILVRNSQAPIFMGMKVRSIVNLVLLFFIIGCHPNDNEQMVSYLEQLQSRMAVRDNFFFPEAKIGYYDTLIMSAKTQEAQISNNYLKGYFLLQAGEAEQAIEIYEDILKKIDPKETESIRLVHLYLGVAYFRLGEQLNCNANRTGESCIFPIQGIGIHQNNLGSKNAIVHFKEALRSDPLDLEARWLLNIANMTLGQYPDSLSNEYLIPGLDSQDVNGLNPFREISSNLKMFDRKMSGGVIVDDFNNDGHLDIVTSAWGLDEPMVILFNNGDGTFTDTSKTSGLGAFTGGLNIQQVDYDNDGYLDIFSLRGGWMGKFGKQPNSLFHNNGDGTFTDVTIQSGMLSFIPTQTATWNDFNRDGWLDVFIGNESNGLDVYPCELYINLQNGKFKNVAYESGIGVIDFVKATSSGDYDNDGWSDVFISTMNNKSYLFRNNTKSGVIKFENVTDKAGFVNHGKTFPSWFWDYDNDGWLDVFLCGYEFTKSLGFYEASEKLNLPLGEGSKMKLYHNNGDGTFTDVAREVGLDKVVNAMGSNFGDVNNDGFLDFYLGTGNPDSKSIIPNRFFRNDNGKMFTDVTSSARLGHLQKGHGIAFADFDNDGDQDIYLNVGGSFKGESNQNCFYVNPGQGKNNWVSIQLRGTKSNSFGVGSRIKVTFRENGIVRSVYRDLNSGGSFGSSPLLAHIGVGLTDRIDRIEVRWSGSDLISIFENVEVNQHVVIEEGKETFTKLSMVPISFNLPQP